MAKLFANSGDPDRTPRSAVSDLGLHCLPITLLQVSPLQWVNVTIQIQIHFVYFYVTEKLPLCSACCINISDNILN